MKKMRIILVVVVVVVVKGRNYGTEVKKERKKIIIGTNVEVHCE